MINSLDGIQIIDVYTVTKYTSSTLYCIMLAVGLIILLGCILFFIYDYLTDLNFNFENVIAGFTALLLAIIMIVNGIIGLNKSKDYPTKIEKTYYEITVDNNLDLKKFLENYTIVGMTDLTLTVTEKEND